MSLLPTYMTSNEMLLSKVTLTAASNAVNASATVKSINNIDIEPGHSGHQYDTHLDRNKYQKRRVEP